MANAQPQPLHTEPVLTFWSIFEQSSIPIALLDEERRIVDINEALVSYYEYPRERLIGTRGGPMVPEDPGLDGRWEQLLRDGHMYGERDVDHADGTRLRVGYAAHVTSVGGRRLVITVALSVRLPGGTELIGRTPIEAPNTLGPKLTPREREVVRLVALGSNTRTIAAELFLSPETVRSHVRNAMSKTATRTRAQLVAKVLSEGLAAG